MGLRSTQPLLAIAVTSLIVALVGALIAALVAARAQSPSTPTMAKAKIGVERARSQRLKALLPRLKVGGFNP
jgi:hypothetical protein